LAGNPGRVVSQWVTVRTERKKTGSGQMNKKTEFQDTGQAMWSETLEPWPSFTNKTICKKLHGTIHACSPIDIRVFD
jgi:hypothetical protein